MTRRRALLPAVVCLMLFAFVSVAAGKTQFHPRVGGALGLIPPVNGQGRFGADDIASGALTPVTYHGGSVMAGGVTVHTIFWAPSGFQFQGSTGGGIPTYIGMIEKFFTDVAADNGAHTNIFSVLPQFAQGSTAGTPSAPGAYDITYNSADPNDAIIDTQPYPSSGQCASPNNATGACVTDAQVQAEVDRVVQSTPGTPRGLHNLWYVFLPPDVDECILPGVCGTNAFGGYHSVSDVGNGTTIYAITIDPIIEAGSIAQGADPQGNPDAEVTADIAGHETVEAMTDPQGVGYMDPNGFEVADKCEFGPQHGTPLGFATNGSPYNQVINGDKWLLQEMWSNTPQGCVQATGSSINPLPLPQVDLTQFSTTVSGNIGGTSPVAGVGVSVKLRRMGADGNPVVVPPPGTGATSGSGTWSVTLSHPVGDDRDEIDVSYTDASGHPGSAPVPNTQVIMTGNGGNPFTESGWTGWTAMDNGSALTNDPPAELQIAPCFQTGLLGVNVAGSAISPPNGDNSFNDLCSTQTDVASVPLSGPVGAGQAVKVSSNDNRAWQDPNLTTVPNIDGGLVNLTVPVGEPDSVSTFASPLIFTPGGFPTCTADLEARTVSCQGLVDGSPYQVNDGSADASDSADGNGDLTVSLVTKGGDSVSLSNSSRTLTTLHVAHLRVDITGEQTVLSGGSCQPLNYYGAPLSSAPTSAAAGAPSEFVGGSDLTGGVCPANGHAIGLDATSIVQTDENSQGATQTEVPDVENTSPMQGETVYGKFTALAESGFPGPANSITPDTTSTVDLSIKHSSGGSAVFHSANVATANGVTVNGLSPGTYTATWTLKDVNGDTRTVTTRFVEQSALQGPTGPRGPQGPRGPRGPAGPKPKVSCQPVKHHKIKCTVTFPKSHKGKLQVRLSRGARVAALGHSKLSGRRATVTLHEVRHLTRGAWTITLVLSQAHQHSSTTTMRLRMA